MERQYPEPKTNTPRAEELTSAFRSKLDSLTMEEKLPPSMAVTILANLNMLSLPMPASVLEKLDLSLGYEVPDDALVVREALRQTNKELVDIGKTVRVPVGDFLLQFNPIRGCRPRRIARAADIPLDLPFDGKKFHFASADCEPELFHEMTLCSDLHVDLLLNRYPFAAYQFIWVPNRFQHHNQFLTPAKDSPVLESACELVWGDGASSSVRIAYNSLGAHASVNHCHFQGFMLTTEWEPPFEKYIQQHLARRGRSGRIGCYYKAAIWISKSDGLKALKSFIEEMNARQQPYHLYITPAGTACFPRKHQADDRYLELLRRSPFTTGFAFFEFLGEIVSPTRDISIPDFEQLKPRIQDLYDVLVPDEI